MPTSVLGETWVDPEELAYPSGSLRQSRRRARVRCADGRLRTARIGVADGYFSIPGSLKARGYTIAGFVYHSEDSGEYRFAAYKYRKNAAVLPYHRS